MFSIPANHFSRCRQAAPDDAAWDLCAIIYKCSKTVKDLLGFEPTGTCVYTEILGLSEYYDGLHVWEFETLFDLTDGAFESSETRYEDGTVQKVSP